MTLQSSHRHRTVHAFAAVVALLTGIVVALAVAGPAAASPCGDKVLADWFDNGRIDRLYPPHCYEDAIDSIPADIRDYADAEEVISRALQGALRGELVKGGCDPTPGDGSGGIPCRGGSGGGSTDGTGGPGTEVTPEVDTSGPSSVPIPLLVLGGMSLALLAAGGLGYLSRRRNTALLDDPGDDDTPV